ncbi:10915_t:CDS:10, partial [Ambispora gerdemannii]
MSEVVDDLDWFQGRSLLVSYIKERKTGWSLYEFLTTHRDTIIKSPPFSEKWEGLETAWITPKRGLLSVVGRQRVFGCRADPSNDCCAPGRWSVDLGVFGCRVGRHRCDLLTKSACANKGLKFYWDGILRERKQLSVEDIHITGSLDLLGKVGKYNVRRMGSKYAEEPANEVALSLSDENDLYHTPEPRNQGVSGHASESDDPFVIKKIADDTLDTLPEMNAEIPSADFSSSRKTRKRPHDDIDPSKSPPLPDYFHTEYSTTIAEISSLGSQVALTKFVPISSREENVAPLRNNPRAKDHLSDNEVQRLRGCASSIVKEEYRMGNSVQALFNSLALSNVLSIHRIATEKRARGVSGVLELLVSNEDKDPDHLRNFLKDIDIHDRDTQYVLQCLDDMDAWICDYGGKSCSERTIDMHLIGPFSRAPGAYFIYGENHSEADRDEKTSRSTTSRTGKPCDFIFLNEGRETGIGENTGPAHKDHYDKSIKLFVEVNKVAKAQHISLINTCMEECGKNPLPSSIDESIKKVAIPFFQIIGSKIRFYILLQIDGDLYGVWEWAMHNITAKDSDIVPTMFLSKKFLVHRNLLNRAGQQSMLAIKKAQLFRERTQAGESDAAEEPFRKALKLNLQETPKTKKKEQRQSSPSSPTPSREPEDDNLF